MLVIAFSLILACFAHTIYAEILEVPGEFSSITLALQATSPHDTVWVRPGIFPDRLMFPSHDVVLISDYFTLGDTSARDSTIIDASAFETLDSSSVLTFVSGSTRATFVGGFTLTGGHGTVYAPGFKRGGCIYCEYSSPTIHSCVIRGNRAEGGMALYAQVAPAAISHCEIYDNCAVTSVASWYGYGANQDTALFEWNDVHHNYECTGSTAINCIGNVNGNIIVRFNHFHDYEGINLVGAELYNAHAQVYGNVFERLSTPDGARGIVVTNFAVSIRDNIFRDLYLGDESCLALDHSGPHNQYQSMIERNWFDNVVNGIGPSCLYMQHPNAEVRENVFFNCLSYVGAVQLSQSAPQGCDVTFERNHFFYNQATYAEHSGSAFNSDGFGPPCTFSNNWFEGNEGWAIHMDSTIQPEADLSNNYWGDPSGPFHSTENPGGLGDSVPANVHVTPWLTAPPGMNEAMEERLALKPEEWTLETAYPNPFNAVVNLCLTTSKPQPFEVSAYNTLGQRVAQVWRGVVPKDSPSLIHWNGTSDQGRNVASGIYYLVVSPRGPGAKSPKSLKVILLR